MKHHRSFFSFSLVGVLRLLSVFLFLYNHVNVESQTICVDRFGFFFIPLFLIILICESCP